MCSSMQSSNLSEVGHDEELLCTCLAARQCGSGQRNGLLWCPAQVLCQPSKIFSQGMLIPHMYVLLYISPNTCSPIRSQIKNQTIDMLPTLVHCHPNIDNPAIDHQNGHCDADDSTEKANVSIPLIIFPSTSCSPLVEPYSGLY